MGLEINKKILSLFLILWMVIIPFKVNGATDIKNDASLGADLVSYWELEETSGTRFDSHGSLDLTSFSVGSATGIQGNAADFGTAAQTYYLSGAVAKTDPLDITGDMTIAFWFYHKDANPVPSNDDLMNRYGASGDVAWRVLLDTNMYFFHHDGTTLRAPNWNMTGQLVQNTWYHVAFVLDVSAQTCTFYFNGSTYGSPGTIGSQTRSSDKPLTIGRWPDGTSNNLNGYIDEVGIWSKTLTNTDISNIYNSGAGLPYDAGGGDVYIDPPKLIWW